MAKFILFFIFFLAAMLSAISTMACTPSPACNDIVSNIKSCQAYIAGKYSEVPDECCSGIMKLNAIALKEKGGRRRICNCMNEFNNRTTAAYENGPVLCEGMMKDLYFRCNIQLSFAFPEKSSNCSMVD